ncbi:ABC transporter ATP-binding protein [Treponema brennaborense]|uniref:Phosphonate-transporting ATPase n=1 Tax=Treponema brennaborense (strain DSM 12168 / CIP 105900 / DD5/3) TaxID=906968 RepID=F4LNZ7_TREBD|nr:Phosphonate-transporting ATPase [Treponema brennaborense DSM 12168]
MTEIVKILSACKIYSMGIQKKNSRRKSVDLSAEVHALNGVSAVIEKGEFTAIAGPSGSGKTTLLNLIGGLDSITSGDIFVDGSGLAKMNKKQKTLLRREKIGFIFQSYNLIPVLSAQENVELALQLLNRFSKEEVKERAWSILKEVGLDGMQDRIPSRLSGGQQQRISIARALVKEPAVILADEPTANLDSKNSAMILDLMKELNEKHSITCIFSTHDQLVMQNVRRIIRLKDGMLDEK